MFIDDICSLQDSSTRKLSLFNGYQDHETSVAEGQFLSRSTDNASDGQGRVIRELLEASKTLRLCAFSGSSGSAVDTIDRSQGSYA
jgi:hypothetical protein